MAGRGAARPRARAGARPLSVFDVAVRHATARVGGAGYHYVECGSGPPLLLLHGWSGSWENFLAWFPVLAPRFRVVVPDLPGCAGAPPLDGPHTQAGYAAFCYELLAALGIAPCYLGGLCSGANIALEVAGRHPSAVGGLLLHTPLYHPRVTKPFFKAQLRLFALSPVARLVRRLRGSATLTGLYRRLFVEGGGISPAANAMNQRNLVRADAGAMRELALDLLHADHVALLRSWRKPLFAIVATDDAFIRYPRFLWINELAPACGVAVIAGGGHGWTPDYLRRQADALEEFVRFTR